MYIQRSNQNHSKIILIYISSLGVDFFFVKSEILADLNRVEYVVFYKESNSLYIFPKAL